MKGKHEKEKRDSAIRDAIIQIISGVSAGLIIELIKRLIK